MTNSTEQLSKRTEDQILLINSETLVCSVGSWLTQQNRMTWLPSYTWNFKEPIDLAIFREFMDATGNYFQIEIEL